MPAKPVSKKITHIMVSHHSFELPKDVKTDSISHLDENGDGMIGYLDQNKCDNLCRSRAYLKIVKPGKEGYAKLFADFVNAHSLAEIMFSSLFCQQAFSAMLLSRDVDIRMPVPCCSPVNNQVLASAELAIIKLAKSQGWKSGSEIELRLKPNLSRSNQILPSNKKIGMNAYYMDFVPYIEVPLHKIKKHPLGSILAPLAEDMMGTWNSVAVLVASPLDLATCEFIPFIDEIGTKDPTQYVEKQLRNAEKGTGGYIVPVLIESK